MSTNDAKAQELDKFIVNASAFLASLIMLLLLTCLTIVVVLIKQTGEEVLPPGPKQPPIEYSDPI